jgi:hypothetical protein
MAQRERRRDRISDRLNAMSRSVSQQATTPRLAALGAMAAGAATYAYLRNEDRRTRLTSKARDYADRVSSWWAGGAQSAQDMPAASSIAVN